MDLRLFLAILLQEISRAAQILFALRKAAQQSHDADPIKKSLFAQTPLCNFILRRLFVGPESRHRA